MSVLPVEFDAFVAEATNDSVARGVRRMHANDLPAGEVTIRVGWSGVNFKDALACVASGKVAQISPLVPGIDLAGSVVASDSTEFSIGDQVIVHGYDLGVAHHGGYSEYARVPAAWVVPLPHGLTQRQAMCLGTAGFTAALSVEALEQRHIAPSAGPVIVTGASGGVGSAAVGLLARRGYHVVAATGKVTAHDRLRALGAAEIVDRTDIGTADKPLQRERWAAAIDCVGGKTLASVLSATAYGGIVTACGNTGGATLPTTVFPFILRGVSLVGIDSVRCPITHRRQVWQRLAADVDATDVANLGPSEVTLNELSQTLETVLNGYSEGHTLVRLSHDA
ncbi:acryloyl-CoA reductase [Haloechinothrix salitolerans]|uniref:Acryloyl-CoA reductase n=1 Tax=Haloechinothrix salitolerans TaxID=926830 RepID=A0ABW2BWZ5_9PSEU